VGGKMELVCAILKGTQINYCSTLEETKEGILPLLNNIK
jgi:hypothetical protein